MLVHRGPTRKPLRRGPGGTGHKDNKRREGRLVTQTPRRGRPRESGAREAGRRGSGALLRDTGPTGDQGGSATGPRG